MSLDRITDDEIIKYICLAEVVNMIEDVADRRQINESDRWKLYKSVHIKRYINNRFPVVKEELEQNKYSFFSKDFEDFDQPVIEE